MLRASGLKSLCICIYVLDTVAYLFSQDCSLIFYGPRHKLHLLQRVGGLCCLHNTTTAFCNLRNTDMLALLWAVLTCNCVLRLLDLCKDHTEGQGHSVVQQWEAFVTCFIKMWLRLCMLNTINYNKLKMPRSSQYKQTSNRTSLCKSKMAVQRRPVHWSSCVWCPLHFPSN